MIDLANMLPRRSFATLALCIAFAISVYALSAQSRYVQILGGISSTNISSKNYPFENTKNRIGFAGGISYEYLFESNVSISVGALYNQRGYVFDIPASNEDLEATFNYDYISVPIKVGYSLGDKVKGFANFGILPSVLLKTVYTFPQFDNQTGIFAGSYQSLDRTDVTQRFDFGAMVEVGGACELSNQWQVFAALAYNHSITDCTTEDFASGSEVRHYGITLSLGVKISLR